MTGPHRVSERQEQPTGPPGPPSNGDGRLRERLATLEARFESLATKEDIQKVMTAIAERDARTSRWLIGVIAGAAVSILAALIRTFIPN